MESVKKWLTNRTTRKNGLYVYYALPQGLSSLSPAQARLLLRAEDSGKLERAVLMGQGRRLLAEAEAAPVVARRLASLMAKCEQLHAAVTGGSLMELQSLLEHDHDRVRLAQCRDQAGVGLLHKAVYFDFADIVAYLVQHYPILVHQQDSEGRTALHYCALSRDEGTLAGLLEGAGASRGTRDRAGLTPAQCRGRAKTQLALPLPTTDDAMGGEGKGPNGLVIKRHNIRIWCHECDMARLQRVVWEGHGSRLLSEMSSQPQVKRFLEAVPYIMNTIRDIHTSVVQNDMEGLMRHTGDPVPPQALSCRDANFLTPMHKAAGLGYGGIVYYIAHRYPESVNDKDNEGRTPLHYAAAMKDDRHIFNSLVGLGADESALDNKNKTPGYYINRPQDIDKNLFKVIPDAPRTPSSSYPSSWDWKLLDAEVIAELNKKSRRKQHKVSTENISAKTFSNSISEKTGKYVGGMKGSSTHELIKDLPDLNDKAKEKKKFNKDTDVVQGNEEKENDDVHIESNDAINTEKEVLLKEEEVLQIVDSESKEEEQLQSPSQPEAINETDHTQPEDAKEHSIKANKLDSDIHNQGEVGDNDENTEMQNQEVEKDEENTEIINEERIIDVVDQENTDQKIKIESDIDDKEINLDEVETKNSIDAHESNDEEEQNHDKEDSVASDNNDINLPDNENYQSEITEENNKEENDKESADDANIIEDDNDVQVQGDVQSEYSDTNLQSTAEASDTGSAKRGNLSSGRNAQESLIEGILNEEVDVESQDATVVNKEDLVQGDVYIVDSEIDPEITDLINTTNMEMLASLVLNGEGSRLIGRSSRNEELQAFLDSVPIYMQKINKIHLAAREGNIRDLQVALDRRKFAIARDSVSPNGATPLHIATIFGKTNIMKYLGGRFPETLSAVDFEGRTALHYAAVLPDNGYYYNLLQQLGANSKDLDDNGRSAEDYINNPKLLSFQQLLSDFGISEEESREMLSDKGGAGVEGGRMDIPIFRTEEGRYLAQSLGDPLIKGLTEVANAKPANPVAFLASFLQNFPEQSEKPSLDTQEKSNALVTHGAAEVENEQPPTFLEEEELENDDISSARPHRPIDVQTLDPTQQTQPDAPELPFSSSDRDEHGQSMLHFAAARTHARNALFQLLQETDVSLAFRDELYRTARDVSVQANVPDNTAEIDKWMMHLAARGKKESIMELLIEGYDHILDVVDEEGVSITDIVSQRGDQDTSSFLASVAAFEDSRDALQGAVRRGDLRTAEESLSAPGGRTLVRAKNSFGRTCMHVAVLAEQEDAVAHLAQHYPELLKIGDNLERTPLHYAMGMDKMESLSRILIRAGAKRVLKDLKGRQPSYYFMNKSDILRLKEEEEVY